VRSSNESARSGYTLVELALASVILTVALGSLLLFSDTSAGALGTQASQAGLDAQCRRALARISRAPVERPERDHAGARSRQTALDADLSLRGRVDGHIAWEAPRAAFAYELGEIDDGIDNNGNSLVDEGVLVDDRRRPPSDQQTKLPPPRELDGREKADGLATTATAWWTSAASPCSARATSCACLTLSLDGEGHTTVRSLETAVQPRN
jgi:hypothetical protein